MSKRAAATAATRSRIVDATRELHGEQGIAATSWEDIAARAGVGVGTVYRHFPSPDELIPACGAVIVADLALPDAGAISALFDGVSGRATRIERLVTEAYGIYERGAPQIATARRERSVHPAVGDFAEEVDGSIAALVDAALEPFELDPDDRAVARAMVDLGTWRALRDQGLSQREAVTAVAQMLWARLPRGPA